MSKPRSPGQQLIAVAMDSQLLAAIDRKRGTVNRSQFIRDILAAELNVSISIAAAPDRAGKGGRSGKPAIVAVTESQSGKRKAKTA